MAASGGETVQQSGEPSVEDILRSIRKVVAGEAGGGGPDRSAATSGAAGDGESADGVLELTDVLDHAPPGEPAGSGDDQPMLSPERQTAVRDSLRALASLAAPGEADRIVSSAESSLDDLTRELLRPMMADWLDRNLPPLVEKLLKAEIARIVGRSP